MKTNKKAFAMSFIMATLLAGCSTYNLGIRKASKIPNGNTNQLNAVVEITKAKSRAEAAQGWGGYNNGTFTVRGVMTPGGIRYW